MTDISARPAPWAPPVEGYHFAEVVVDDDWLVPAIGAGRCRAGAGPGTPACGKPAVASLLRPVWKSSPRRRRPWDYCAEHLYGRWLEDGKVMSWRMVADEADDG